MLSRWVGQLTWLYCLWLFPCSAEKGESWKLLRKRESQEEEEEDKNSSKRDILSLPAFSPFQPATCSYPHHAIFPLNLSVIETCSLSVTRKYCQLRIPTKLISLLHLRFSSPSVISYPVISVSDLGSFVIPKSTYKSIILCRMSSS